MRVLVGVTLEEVARQLDKTKSALSRLETGQSRMDVHVGMMGSFNLPEFPEDDPDLMYVSSRTSRGRCTSRIRTRWPEATRQFARLRSEALSPVESVAFIHRIADQM